MRGWWTIGLAVAASGGLLGYRWFRAGTNWGSTADERASRLPGDETVPQADYACTRAVTIDAEPRHVWPWLAQMGNGRGGLYSYDWLDRLFGILDGPSAKEVLPQFQEIHAGDVIPIGAGNDFPVLEVRPERALVLGGAAAGVRWLWSLVLEPLEGGQTRLLSRNRATVGGGPWSRFFIAGVDMAATIMTRRMLLNLKQRAEGLREGEERRAMPLEATSVG